MTALILTTARGAQNRAQRGYSLPGFEKNETVQLLFPVKHQENCKFMVILFLKLGNTVGFEPKVGMNILPLF